MISPQSLKLRRKEKAIHAFDRWHGKLKVAADPKTRPEIHDRIRAIVSKQSSRLSRFTMALCDDVNAEYQPAIYAHT